MTWATLPLLSVDCETTGVDPATDRIVEAAAVTINPNGTVGNRQRWLINPGVNIPTEASNIHGVTTEIAQRDGIHPADALRQLGETIATHPGPVVIYNAVFDWPLLITEADRHGLIWPVAPLLDPLVLDKHIDPYRRGSRQLIDVAAHYAITVDPDSAHGALADATAAGQTMAALIAHTPAIATTSLDALQTWQARWNDEQAASFTRYRRRTDPTFTKEPGWPTPNGSSGSTLPLTPQDPPEPPPGERACTLPLGCRPEARNKKMWAMTAEAWPSADDRDELRRTLIGVITAGRTESSKNLTATEWDALFTALDQITQNERELFLRATGDYEVRPTRKAKR